MISFIRVSGLLRVSLLKLLSPDPPPNDRASALNIFNTALKIFNNYLVGIKLSKNNWFSSIAELAYWSLLGWKTGLNDFWRRLRVLFWRVKAFLVVWVFAFCAFCIVVFLRLYGSALVTQARAGLAAGSTWVIGCLPLPRAGVATEPYTDMLACSISKSSMGWLSTVPVPPTWKQGGGVTSQLPSMDERLLDGLAMATGATSLVIVWQLLALEVNESLEPSGSGSRRRRQSAAREMAQSHHRAPATGNQIVRGKGHQPAAIRRAEPWDGRSLRRGGT